MEEKEITRNGLTFIVDVDAYDKIIKRTDENVDKMQQELDKLKIENDKLKQWDKDKDTRNSRQRVANAKLIKENKELQEKLNKKQKIIDKAKTKSIELQNKYGYILDDLIFLLDILGGVDNEC